MGKDEPPKGPIHHVFDGIFFNFHFHENPWIEFAAVWVTLAEGLGAITVINKLASGDEVTLCMGMIIVPSAILCFAHAESFISKFK